MFHSPKNKWSFFVYAILSYLICGYAILVSIGQYFNSESHPPDMGPGVFAGGIMFMGFITLFFPVFILLTYLLTKFYKGRVAFFNWNSKKLFISLALTIVALIFSIVVVQIAWVDFVNHIYSSLILLLSIPVVLTFRSEIIAKS